MAKQRTRDRTLMVKRLDTNQSLISVSISYDGGIKYDEIPTCGISSTDSTQHRLFALEIDLAEECPFDPCKIGAVEMSNLARDYMKSQGVELNPESYEVFMVSPLQKNLAGPKAVRPKYRAVVNPMDLNADFTPGQSLEEPGTFRRMPHFVFGKVLEMKAPMENKHGSSAAVNISQIYKSAAIMKRFLCIAHTTASTPMPGYVSSYTFSSVEALKRLVDYVAELSTKNDELLGFVSGNTLSYVQCTRTRSVVELFSSYLGNLSVREVVARMSKTFEEVAADLSMELPLGVLYSSYCFAHAPFSTSQRLLI